MGRRDRGIPISSAYPQWRSKLRTNEALAPRLITPSDRVDVCMCGDDKVRVGLHVTLASALAGLRKGVRLHVKIVDLGLSDEEPSLLRDTLQLVGHPFDLEVERIDVASIAE